MLPGRQLIEEIEYMLSELDADEYEFSEKLEQYVLDNGDSLLREWRDIKKKYTNKHEQLYLMFDVIQSEIAPELEEAEETIKRLGAIDKELDDFIAWSGKLVQI